jgi:hypothetical protein
MTDNERATCAALAGLLRAAALLALWGFALTCIAALVLALTLRSLSSTAAMGLGAVVILGALERYFAFRLRFDQALFDGLARNTVASLNALDHALSALGLRPRRSPAAARPLADRVQGTRQLHAAPRHRGRLPERHVPSRIDDTGSLLTDHDNNDKNEPHARQVPDSRTAPCCGAASPSSRASSSSARPGC